MRELIIEEHKPPDWPRAAEYIVPNEQFASMITEMTSTDIKTVFFRLLERPHFAGLVSGSKHLSILQGLRDGANGMSVSQIIRLQTNMSVSQIAKLRTN